MESAFEKGGTVASIVYGILVVLVIGGCLSFIILHILAGALR